MKRWELEVIFLAPFHFFIHTASLCPHLCPFLRAVLSSQGWRSHHYTMHTHVCARLCVCVCVCGRVQRGQATATLPKSPHFSFTVNLLACKSKIQSSKSTTIPSIGCLLGPEEKATSHPLAPQILYQSQIPGISVRTPPLT